MSPGVIGLGFGTSGGGAGRVLQRSLFSTTFPRRGGFEPEALPVRLMKAPVVNSPDRCAGFKETGFSAVPVMPGRPYKVARSWFANELVPVMMSAKRPVPLMIVELTKLRTSLSIEFARSGVN